MSYSLQDSLKSFIAEPFGFLAKHKSVETAMTTLETEKIKEYVTKTAPLVAAVDCPSLLEAGPSESMI